MKKHILAFLIFSAFMSRAFAQHYTVTSPDDNLKMDVKVNDSITYAVIFKGTAVVTPSAISMKLDTRVLGLGAKVIDMKKSTVKKEIHPTNGKQTTLSDNYNELIDGKYLLTTTPKK